MMNKKRVWNFSAGPSMLPPEVLEQAQQEFVCYGSSGMSSDGNEPSFQRFYKHTGTSKK